MSTYERESGEYIIPRAAWRAFHAKMVWEFNCCQRRFRERVTALYDALERRRAAAGEAFDVHAELMQIRDSAFRLHGSYGRRTTVQLAADDEDVLDLLVNGTLEKPDPDAIADATSRTTRFPAGFGCIDLEPKRRAVVWSVRSTNHAVVNAREHPVALAFFRAIAKVAFTRGSGGFIVYTNEYMRERDFGESTEVRDAHGPIGERETQARLRAMTAYAAARVPARKTRGSCA